eukprot:4101081-Pleurochrysis_carterae.AAC.1
MLGKEAQSPSEFRKFLRTMVKRCNVRSHATYSHEKHANSGDISCQRSASQSYSPNQCTLIELTC